MRILVQTRTYLCVPSSRAGAHARAPYAYARDASGAPAGDFHLTIAIIIITITITITITKGVLHGASGAPAGDLQDHRLAQHPAPHRGGASEVGLKLVVIVCLCVFGLSCIVMLFSK